MNSMMNALVLHGLGDTRYEKVSKPKPQSNSVLIKVGFCGVCGSDIPRTFTNGTYKFPTICGHEFSGTIEECGESIRNFNVGDRVTVFPLIWCGKCPACEEGKYAQCADYDYLGSRSNGAFAEYVVAPEKNLIRIPDSVSLEHAAMTEPAAVALHAVNRAKSHLADATVAIWGAGPIGLLTAQWARIMGAARVLIFDLIEEKLQLARQLGFSDVFNSRQMNPVQCIHDLTQNRGVQVAIEAAGVPATFIQALQAMGRSGCMILLGNPSDDVTLPAPVISHVMRQEIDILGVWNSTYKVAEPADDWRTVLVAMEQNKLQCDPLITHIVDLSQAFSTLVRMKEGKEFFCKTLINPSMENI